MRTGDVLLEAKFNQLASHYKETYELHVACIQQRDRLFYALLAVVGIFSLQLGSVSVSNSLVAEFLKNSAGITIGTDSSLIATLIWFALFGLSTKYYQVVVQVERQYPYLHDLETLLSRYYPGTNAFTREGKSYLWNYPAFSNWIWFLYTIAFPVLIVFGSWLQISTEIIQHGIYSYSVAFNFVCYLMIGTTTALYLGKMHEVTIRRLSSWVGRL